MTTPVDTPSTMPTVDMDSLTQALGNAAERAAEKGAGTQNGGEAKAFGAAALSFTQALMLIIAPHVPPPGSQGPRPPAQA